MKPITHATLLALVMSCAGTQAFATERRLGTLFHTATEREALAHRALKVEAQSPAEPPVPHDLPPFRLDGVLWKDSRPVMLWVDRQPFSSAASLGATVKLPTDWQIHLAPDHIRLIDAAGQTSRLHAGEHWPLASPAFQLERSTAKAR